MAVVVQSNNADASGDHISSTINTLSRYSLRDITIIQQTHTRAVVSAVRPDGKKVVIKVADSSTSRPGDDLENEHQIATHIHSIPKKPNGIPQALLLWDEVNEQTGFQAQCLMAEFVEGQELFNIIANFWYFKDGSRREHSPKRIYEWMKKVRKWFQQLVKKLDFLQSNKITHNDLSAENLMISPDGDVCLIDFGLSIQFQSSNFQTQHPRHVKPGYTAIEAWERDGPEYDAGLADIYSAGCILLFLLSGEVDGNRLLLNYLAVSGIKGVKAFFHQRQFETFDFVPPDAVDLLGKILVCEENRISMEDLKKHPYVRDQAACGVDVAEWDDETLSEVNADDVFRNQDVTVADVGS